LGEAGWVSMADVGGVLRPDEDEDDVAGESDDIFFSVFFTDVGSYFSNA
jgi:hypothetical protein